MSNDANDGSIGHPVKTIAHGVALARGGGGGGTVVLRAGTFRPAETVVLTAADSGLTLQNYPGEAARVLAPPARLALGLRSRPRVARARRGARLPRPHRAARR